MHKEVFDTLTADVIKQNSKIFICNDYRDKLFNKRTAITVQT